ncbi:hypothetical protein [Sutcliffiella halmapala]|uniref:hypothetical protein n=1 Tax=Sutcliffiella halmapala TaxID=79882 RepID=UPI000994ED12|nr:hypothetical protein [Sutcliffiella halmapala]
MSNYQELIMIQQQVIHYKAEISKFKDQIKELELDLEKEGIRNKYLQARVKSLQNQHGISTSNLINQLRKKVLHLEVSLEEEKKLSETLQQSTPMEIKSTEKKETSFYGYFNYSILHPSDGETTLTIISDFNIVNVGDMEMEDVIICLKIMPINKIVFSGKISNPKLVQQTDQNRPAANWVYAIENWKDKIRMDGEYWIRSLQMPNIAPKENASFKSFEIHLERQDSPTKYTVEAFIYCKDNTIGLPSNNKIMIRF